MNEIEAHLFQTARDFRDQKTRGVNEYREFVGQTEQENLFFRLHWCRRPECEEKIKADTKATIRCIPIANPQAEGPCIVCGAPSRVRVIVAKAY